MPVAGLISLVFSSLQHNRAAPASGFYWRVLGWLHGPVLSYILGVGTLF